MELHDPDGLKLEFRSIYFREPGEVLFEIATDPPGFTVDEPRESLGSKLQLPKWIECERNFLQKILPPIKVPTGACRWAKISRQGVFALVFSGVLR